MFIFTSISARFNKGRLKDFLCAAFILIEPLNLIFWNTGKSFCRNGDNIKTGMRTVTFGIGLKF